MKLIVDKKMSSSKNEQTIGYYENGSLQCLLSEQDAKQVIADDKSWGNKVSLVEDRHKKKKRIYVEINVCLRGFELYTSH